jgi:hypothetical protein
LLPPMMGRVTEYLKVIAFASLRHADAARAQQGVPASE